MYRLHGSILAYGGEDARSTADSVITALTPAAWYRNATGVTSAGGFASQWDDYSGNTRHLVQATGTNQPAYAAGVFTFDGADNYMKAAAFTLNQPETIYLVVNMVGWTSGDDLFDGEAVTSMMVQQRTGAASPRIAQYAGAYGAETVDLTIGAFGVLAAVFNGASSLLQVNAGSATTGNAGASNAGGFILGSAGGGTNQSNIQVEEAIVFAAAHDASTRSSVITALNNALTVF